MDVILNVFVTVVKNLIKTTVLVKRVGGKEEEKETAIRVICPGIGLQYDFDSLKRVICS